MICCCKLNLLNNSKHLGWELLLDPFCDVTLVESLYSRWIKECLLPSDQLDQVVRVALISQGPPVKEDAGNYFLLWYNLSMLTYSERPHNSWCSWVLGQNRLQNLNIFKTKTYCMLGCNLILIPFSHIISVFFLVLRRWNKRTLMMKADFHIGWFYKFIFTNFQSWLNFKIQLWKLIKEEYRCYSNLPSARTKTQWYTAY